MRQRLVHSLLVAALLVSNTSAPFAHVHPYGHDHSAPLGSEGSAGDRDTLRHLHGIHWHLDDRPEPGTLSIGDRVSIALAAALEMLPAGVDTLPALADMACSQTVAEPAGRAAPRAACAAPEPPPKAPQSARAPACLALRVLRRALAVQVRGRSTDARSRPPACRTAAGVNDNA